VTETETDLAKELRISAEQDKARSEQHRRDAVEVVQARAKKKQKTTGNNPGQTSPSRRGKNKDKADKTSPNRARRRQR
jgi:hypothetical protein